MSTSSGLPDLPPYDADAEARQQEDLALASSRSLVVGLVALVLLGVCAAFDTTAALQSWLVAWLFVLGFALGSLALLHLNNATGGAWGVAIRRPCEAAARTLPFVAALFVPVLLGMGRLYPWASEEVVAADALLQHKRPFLNPTTFVAASVGYFAVWFLLLRVAVPRTVAGSGALDRYPTRGQRRVAGFCLATYVLSMSFAAFHWAMSLEPHWFSTIYGLMFVVGQALASLALAIVVTARLSARPPLAGAVSRDQFHDLGNLSLALVMLWAYVALSQFLIIWSANLAEEAPWYVARSHHGWNAVAVVLVLFHFALPFTVLLSRRSKRAPALLALVAVGLIVMRIVDLGWLVTPAFHPDGLHVSLTDPVAIVALGALWLAAYFRYLGQRSVVYRPEPVRPEPGDVQPGHSPPGGAAEVAP